MEHRQGLEDLLAEAVATKAQAEWRALFVEWDVPGAPINNIADVFQDPQVLHRNMLVEIDHPAAGRIKTSGNPIKTGHQERFTPPPLLGQHTREVLSTLAGYTDEQLDVMQSAEVI